MAPRAAASAAKHTRSTRKLSAWRISQHGGGCGSWRSQQLRLRNASACLRQRRAMRRWRRAISTSQAAEANASGLPRHGGENGAETRAPSIFGAAAVKCCHQRQRKMTCWRGGSIAASAKTAASGVRRAHGTLLAVSNVGCLQHDDSKLCSHTF